MKIRNLIAGAILLSLHSFAGTILVSGDSSIGVSVTGGNAQFFSNVLGSGTNVLIQELDPGTALIGSNIASYYNGLAGVTATQTTSTSVTNLSAVNVFITMLPQSVYSSGELSAIGSLLNSGGTVFFIAENPGYTPGGPAVPNINSALSTLGSNISLSGYDSTIYPVTATVVSNPLTAGVTNFQYGFTSYVTGGTPLFEDANANPFIAVQTTGGSTTPEPMPGALTLGGLSGILWLARRRKQ